MPVRKAIFDDVPLAELEWPGDSMAINTGGSDGSSVGGSIGPAVIMAGTARRRVAWAFR